MAFTVYVKIMQGKLRHLSSWPLSTLSASCGGAFIWNRSMFTGEPTVEKHAVQSYPENKLEKMFRDLLNEKGTCLTKLECVQKEKKNLRHSFATGVLSGDVKGVQKFRTIWEKERYGNLTREARELGVCSWRLKSLRKEEESLFSTLESTVKQIEELQIRLGNKRAKELFNSSDEDACGGEESPAMAKFLHLREATQYFDLIDYLFNYCKSVKHDSSLLEILMNFGDELKENFPFLDEQLLQKGVDYYLGKVRRLHYSELEFKFGLWLLSSNIEVDNVDVVIPSPLTWRNFCAAIDLPEEVKDSEFSELDSFQMSKMFQMYVEYKSRSDGGEDDELRSLYEEKLTMNMKACRERILQVLNDIQDSDWCMVFKTWKQGYHMDIHGDPKTEVLEMEKYLEEIECDDEESSS